MKQIKVNVTTSASPDGIAVVEYKAGTVCEMTDRLGDLFIAQGWGELAELPAADRAEVVADAADGAGLQTTVMDAEKLMRLTKDELTAMVQDAGLEVPAGATKAVLVGLLMDGNKAPENKPAADANAAGQVESGGAGETDA